MNNLLSLLSCAEQQGNIWKVVMSPRRNLKIRWQIKNGAQRAVTKRENPGIKTRDTFPLTAVQTNSSQGRGHILREHSSINSAKRFTGFLSEK
jgi:hypothetical protein